MIRDAYSALIPNILLLVWNYVMSMPVPKGSEKWAAIVSLVILIVRSGDRAVRAWIAAQKAKSL